eukprot:jgi/Undpi1/457/HiC_scaffold_1.g00453.m1
MGVLEKRMERAIYDAIRGNGTEPIVGLIRAGVSPNFKRPAGETCLHAAAYCGAMSLVKDLSRRKSDPAVKDSHGNLPVDLAAMQGKDDVDEDRGVGEPEGRCRRLCGRLCVWRERKDVGKLWVLNREKRVIQIIGRWRRRGSQRWEGDGSGAVGLGALLTRPDLAGVVIDSGKKVGDVVGFDDKFLNGKRKRWC